MPEFAYDWNGIEGIMDIETSNMSQPSGFFTHTHQSFTPMARIQITKRKHFGAFEEMEPYRAHYSMRNFNDTLYI